MANLESEVPKIAKLAADYQVNDPDHAFSLQFWGVRGQIPAPGKNTVIYGGNTACVEICVAQKRLIFDGGTGLRILGNELLKQIPIEAHLFFTNCHWDRIQGFPFFTPAFIPTNSFHIYGADTSNGCSFQECLRNQMRNPNFPITMDVMGSKLNFHRLQAGDNVGLDDLIINTAWLDRVTRSIGYRINWQNHSVVYTTAHDSNLQPLGNKLTTFAQNADLLIINAPQTNQNQDFSTACQEIVKLGRLAAVKKIIISNHHPDSDDNCLERMESNLSSILPNTILAREGMIVRVA